MIQKLEVTEDFTHRESEQGCEDQSQELCEELSFEEIDQLIKTQGLQLRRWKAKDLPLGDFPILSFTFQNVEGFKAGEIPACWGGKVYEIRPRPRASKTPRE